MNNKEDKYKIKTYQILTLVCSAIFLVTCALTNEELDDEIRTHELIQDFQVQTKSEPEIKFDYRPFDGNYSRSFDDLNDLHLKTAQEIGFAAMSHRRDTARMKGKFIYYESREYENFIVDTLEHSLPIMTLRASKLIEEIATNFRDSLKNLNCPDCKIIVTSLTRTEEDIKKLRRKNRNAINESTHRYGTTFDISWIRFKQVDSLDTRVAYDRLLKKALGRTLYRLQQENKCFVKYEQHQKCFHITVRKYD